MGCCKSNKKKSKEKELVELFQSKFNSLSLSYTIPNYDKNFSSLNKEFKKNFEEISLKESIRQKFVNEIIKVFKKLETTDKILYFILILTISLKSSNEQQKKKLSTSLTFNSKVSSISSYQEHSNDLEQALLSVSSMIINKKEQSIPKLKLLLYYNTKMLKLMLDSRSKSIGNYICIDNYVESIVNVLQNSDSLNEEEKRLFLEEIFICLGLIFKSLISNRKPSHIINTQEQDLLLESYTQTYLYHSEYVKTNFEEIKNILCKVHETHCAPLLNENETEDNNVVKTQETVFKKDPKFIALAQLNNSFFYFLYFFIKDTSIGSKLFHDIQSALNNNLLFQIIIIYIFQKEINDSRQKRLIITSIFDFLTQQNFQNYDELNFYLNLLFQYFKEELLKDNVLKEKCQTLLVDLFINHLNINDVILDSVYTFPNKSNLLLMDFIFVVDFIYNVSNQLTEINSFENQFQVLSSFIDLLDNKLNNQYSEIITNNSRNTNNLIAHKNRNLPTQIFITVIQNFADISNSIEIGDKIATFKINYIKFFILFYNYCTQHYELEPENDKNLRDQMFSTIINLIYDLILLNGINDVNNYNKYSKEIINLLRLLINYILQETHTSISDYFAIYNLLGNLYMKISKQKDLKTTVPFLSHIYKITFGLIIIQIHIYGLTISPTIINNEIITKTSNLNLEHSIAFSEDDLNDLIKQVQNHNKYLLLLQQKIEFNEIITSHNNGYISLESFNQILKIIYSTMFGHSSKLYLFNENQENTNSKLDEQRSVVVTEAGEKLDIKEINLNFTINNPNENKQKSYLEAINDFPSFEKVIKEKQKEMYGNENHEQNNNNDDRFEHNNILSRIDNINNYCETEKSRNIKI